MSNGASNIILFGPPGTGKTYATTKLAVKLCGVKPPENELIRTVYERLRDEGRIEFVTFHQSMSYEDFVEGRQPDTGSDDSSGESTGGFRLKTVPGVFRRLVSRAIEDQVKEPNFNHISEQNIFSTSSKRIFKASVGSNTNRDDDHIFEDAIKKSYVPLNVADVDIGDNIYEDKLKISDAVNEELGSSDKGGKMAGMLHRFRNIARIGDIVVVSKGNKKFRAIGEITGDYAFCPKPGGGYAHQRSVKWHWLNRDGLSVSHLQKSDFIQNSFYILKRDNINIDNINSLIYLKDKDDTDEAFKVKEEVSHVNDYVMIIDEINRANISKVFGELITLIEPDKRLGAPNELIVTLPYSGDKFGIPSNLHIIGTMNTADRSVALIDTALRRRFKFEEMIPDLTALPKDCEVNLRKLLVTINGRIEYLYDREHQIGHAYFTNCHSKADVDEVMRYKVIPLLFEYFFDDFQKVACVLGDNFSGEDEAEGGFLNRTIVPAPPGTEADEGSPRFSWRVRSEKEKFDYSNLTEVDET